MQLRLFFLFVFTLSQAQAALPPSAQDYLNKIPGQKVSLPFVISRALESAEAYKDLAFQFASAELSEDMVLAQEDTMLTGGTNFADDNSVKTNPFQPPRVQSWNWNLGVAKKWASGTSTSLNWKHEFVDQRFDPSNAFVLSNPNFITFYKQTIASIQIQQSLLKDAFGYGYRKQLNAARKEGDALRWKTRGDFEKTTLDFIGIFYQAWMSQQQVLSLQDEVKRREKLVSVMKKKFRTGTIERPELIQIEAALADSKTRLGLGENTLRQVWEGLVITLRLPQEFLAVDPKEVPTIIDDPLPQGVRVCRTGEPKTTADIETLNQKMEALESSLDAIGNMALPELNLVAGLTSNGIDSSGSQTIDQVFNGRDPNIQGLGPAWSVGLTLKWPLANTAARTEKTAKWIEKQRVGTQLAYAKDQLKANWRDLCRKLSVERENEKIFQNIVKEQMKRVQAQNKRFSLGRVSVNEMAQAEDDLARWELLSQQKSVEVRNIAWQVRRLSGDLFAQMEPMLKNRMKDIKDNL